MVSFLEKIAELRVLKLPEYNMLMVSFLQKLRNCDCAYSQTMVLVLQEIFAIATLETPKLYHIDRRLSGKNSAIAAVETLRL